MNLYNFIKAEKCVIIYDAFINVLKLNRSLGCTEQVWRGEQLPQAADFFETTFFLEQMI